MTKLAVAVWASTLVSVAQLSQDCVGFEVLVIRVTVKVIVFGYCAAAGSTMESAIAAASKYFIVHTIPHGGRIASGSLRKKELLR